MGLLAMALAGWPAATWAWLAVALAGWLAVDWPPPGLAGRHVQFNTCNINY
jgi:hypothetical protein